MRGTLASSLTRRTWWWVFALFIAAPAVALTWLGFRSIRAAEIERDQRLREEQAGVARLVDASLASALDRTITDVKAAGHLDDAVAFFVEDTGVIAFPADRVYFGPFGVTPSSLPALHTPSSITALIGQAQTAEARGRHVEARALYERIRADRDLAAWANLKLAMVAVDSGDRSRLSAVADSRLATSNARTPAGIPLAVAAASYARTLNGRERARLLPLVAATFEELRGGRWWLHADQRRAYDAELRSVLADSDGPGNAPEADSRLERIGSLDSCCARPRQRERASRRGQRSSRPTRETSWLCGRRSARIGRRGLAQRFSAPGSPRCSRRSSVRESRRAPSTRSFVTVRAARSGAIWPVLRSGNPSHSSR